MVQRSLAPPWFVAQVVAFMIAFPLTIGLMVLFVWHVQLVAENKTTIEYQEVRMAGWGWGWALKIPN